MSAGVAVWRALARATHVRVHTREMECPVVETPDQEPIVSLVRQVFLSGAPRKRLLLVAPGPETKVQEICEEVGQKLSELSGGRVAIVSAEAHLQSSVKLKKRAQSVGAEEPWLPGGVQLAQRLWRFPSSSLSNSPKVGAGTYASWGDLPFDYVLCASVVSDSVTPLFCSFCTEAVLALTAHRTRRDSALRARDILRQCNAELLGTVLDGRLFPIPESIYRRL